VEDLSEKEQIEQLRTWWSDYGNWLIGGVVLAALGLFGLNYYQESRLESALAASGLYDQLTDLVVEGDLDEAESVSGKIIADFPDTAYAPQARLAMARLYMDTNRDEDAAGALNGVLASDADDEYKKVARLRLAKVLLYQDKPEEALEVLGPAGETDGAFSARYDEVRGDTLVALERPDEAREAYRRALSESGRETTVNQQFVQLKLLDLPVEEVAAANEPASDLPPADAPPVPAEDAAAGEAADHDETDPPPGGETDEGRE
jgi:predicted negative regulator of RcsB-dependent stress response